MIWRVGSKVPRNIYLDDEPVAMLATPELAANIVGSLNDRFEWKERAEKAEAEVARLRCHLYDIAQGERSAYDAKCIAGLALKGSVTTSAKDK